MGRTDMKGIWFPDAKFPWMKMERLKGDRSGKQMPVRPNGILWKSYWGLEEAEPCSLECVAGCNESCWDQSRNKVCHLSSFN